MIPIGIIVLCYTGYNFQPDKINTGMIALSVVTVFFSSYLRIQLPRTKIHLTISDALVFLSMLIYGSETAILISALESLFTSLNFRNKGISIKPKTIILNIVIAVTTTFITSQALQLIFSAPVQTIEGLGDSQFILMLTGMALCQFLVNSVCVSIFISIKSEKTLWQVWNEYCLNALVIYVAGAGFAGISVKALHQIDMVLFAVVIGFASLLFMTYRRYVEDVKSTAALAEQAERERAEQAEKHVEELQHHIAEQEKTSEALRESRERFRHAAYHDTLTDLPNRNKFIETLSFQIEKAKHNPQYRFAVLFLDLNRFKTINESLGHSVGDQLILHVANRLTNLVGKKDLVARFSGDEFAIILSKINGAEDAANFADLIKNKISAPFTIEGRQIFTSVSIGIAFGNALYKQAEDVLRDADIAMYHAKESKHTYEIFNPTMHARAVTLLQLETDLRHAIERDELLVYYQPIIDLKNMQLRGFEALMRWSHPQRGIVPPGEFIPVSEETGLIIPMTLWILRESCRQLVKWQQRNPLNALLMISVNLSGKHFARPDLVEQVKTILEETKINPKCVKLELTESAVMDNAETAIEMLKQLRGLGVQLSIDDFGTGYSSLSYLHRFPIDMLKVDRSFVSTMEEGTENGEIVRTIISLAKTLKLSVVAEGIESIHQLHQLRVLGCEYGQGFLFSRPIPNHEIDKILDDRNRWQRILPESNMNFLSQGDEISLLQM
ncbi:MAG TPA: EAL domain-containing protein [Pyrinomonadaceae bacterium]|nr:EAL domain-containing protein [Pyrinomonadaceae bacterium]